MTLAWNWSPLGTVEEPDRAKDVGAGDTAVPLSVEYPGLRRVIELVVVVAAAEVGLVEVAVYLAVLVHFVNH